MWDSLHNVWLIFTNMIPMVNLRKMFLIHHGCCQPTMTGDDDDDDDVDDDDDDDIR